MGGVRLRTMCVAALGVLLVVAHPTRGANFFQNYVVGGAPNSFYYNNALTGVGVVENISYIPFDPQLGELTQVIVTGGAIFGSGLTFDRPTTQINGMDLSAGFTITSSGTETIQNAIIDVPSSGLPHFYQGHFHPMPVRWLAISGGAGAAITDYTTFSIVGHVSIDYIYTPVPEPALALPLVCLMALARRRRRKSVGACDGKRD